MYAGRDPHSGCTGKLFPTLILTGVSSMRLALLEMPPDRSLRTWLREPVAIAARLTTQPTYGNIEIANGWPNMAAVNSLDI